MFLLEIMVFNFQYLSSFWNEIAADTLYETFTSSQHKAWKFTSPAVFHKDLRNFLRKYRARLGLGFMYNRQLWNSGASMVFKKGMFLERKGDFGKATSSGKSCSTQLCMKLAQEVFIRKTYWLCVCVILLKFTHMCKERWKSDCKGKDHNPRRFSERWYYKGRKNEKESI